ncbi:hypothetical protein EVAR_55096_1 [Eumeta japonica]|uniref:Uncharacterized protein n=1 Tax=Eumeta variegata TaxID=151549 RepID=A0A4C1YFA9_EUMVA|nr:hypothetical protein EVAR_55096_1 [Eumeta japonica]
MDILESHLVTGQSETDQELSPLGLSKEAADLMASLFCKKRWELYKDEFLFTDDPQKKRKLQLFLQKQLKNAKRDARGKQAVWEYAKGKTIFEPRKIRSGLEGGSGRSGADPEEWRSRMNQGFGSLS